MWQSQRMDLFSITLFPIQMLQAPCCPARLHPWACMWSPRFSFEPLPLNLSPRCTRGTPERHYPADAPWEGERWGGLRCVYEGDLSLIKTFACSSQLRLSASLGQCMRAGLSMMLLGLSAPRGTSVQGHATFNQVLCWDIPCRQSPAVPLYKGLLPALSSWEQQLSVETTEPMKQAALLNCNS